MCAQHQHQMVDALAFFCAAYNKIQAFCTICTVCSYSELESPVIVCILPIPYLISEVAVMVCEKNPKSIEIKSFAKSRQGRYCVKSVRVRSFSSPHFPTFKLNT